MLVKDLKKELEKYDENLQVAVYVSCGEDMDLVRKGVRVETRDETTQSYCKGTHVLNFRDINADKVLVIG